MVPAFFSGVSSHTTHSPSKTLFSTFQGFLRTSHLYQSQPPGGYGQDWNPSLFATPKGEPSFDFSPQAALVMQIILEKGLGKEWAKLWAENRESRVQDPMLPIIAFVI